MPNRPQEALTLLAADQVEVWLLAPPTSSGMPNFSTT
jgi:hypothetical protein